MNQQSNPAEAVLAEAITTVPPLWRLQLVRFFEILGIIAMFLGGAEFLDLLNTLPAGSAPAWAFLIGGTVNKTAKPLIMFFGDWFDDGVINKSFSLDRAAAVLILGVLCAFMLSLQSCAALGSAISKQPIQTTPVQRADGTGAPFELATSDLLKAEQDSLIASTAKVPRRQWGLYDAGYLAAKATQVIDSGK